MGICEGVTRTALKDMSDIPKREEESSDDARQDPDRPMFGLDEYFDDAVHECRYPQKPLEESCKHDQPHNGSVDNLNNGKVSSPPGARSQLFTTNLHRVSAIFPICRPASWTRQAGRACDGEGDG